MTPINLEDVESYLKERVGDIYFPPTPGSIKKWIEVSFSQLRAREAAVLKTEGSR